MRILTLLSSFLFLILIISCSTPENETNPTPVQPSTIEYTLTVSSGTGGTVSTSGGTYEEGSAINVTATPNNEYVFSGWSNGSTDNPLTITINSDTTVSAVFTKRRYPLTVNVVGEGSVNEEVVTAGKTTTEYTSGSVIRLTANPSNDEWEFSFWSGSVSSTTNPIEVTVDQSKTITATFSNIDEDDGGDWRHFDNVTGPSGVTVEYQSFRDSKEDLFFNYRINGLSDTIRLVAFTRLGQDGLAYPEGNDILSELSAHEGSEPPLSNFIIAEFDRIEYLNRTIYIESGVTSITEIEVLKSSLNQTINTFGDCDAGDYDSIMVITNSRNYGFGGLALDETTIYNGPYNFTPYVIAHEIGHVWSLRQSSPVNWDEWGVLAENNYVSDYGETAIREHFAEAFSFFFTGTSIPQPLINKLTSYGLIQPSSSSKNYFNSVQGFKCGIKHKY